VARKRWKQKNTVEGKLHEDIFYHWSVRCIFIAQSLSVSALSIQRCGIMYLSPIERVNLEID
jgi:hypothetical protein